MKRMIAIVLVIPLLAGCEDGLKPTQERALAGGAIGATAGALLGAVAGAPALGAGLGGAAGIAVASMSDRLRL